LSKIIIDPSEFAEDVRRITEALQAKGAGAAEPLAAEFMKKYSEGARATKGSDCAGCASCTGCAVCGISAIEAIQAGHLLRAFHLS
jgi:succinate dehydrogenase/fumarate reductase-like Fe-S protein